MADHHKKSIMMDQMHPIRQ